MSFPVTEHDLSALLPFPLYPEFYKATHPIHPLPPTSPVTSQYGSAPPADNLTFYPSKETNPSGLSPTFTLFPELPAHVRLQIWHLVDRPPRRIFIISGSPIDPWGQCRALPSTTPTPALLLVCKESHAVARSYYLQLTFSSGLREPGIWLNAKEKIDVLYFVTQDARFHGAMSLPREYCPKTIILRHGIRKLRHRSSHEVADFVDDVLRTSRMFPGIGRIVVVGNNAGFNRTEEVPFRARIWGAAKVRLEENLGRWRFAIEEDGNVVLEEIPSEERMVPELLVLSWPEWIVHRKENGWD